MYTFILIAMIATSNNQSTAIIGRYENIVDCMEARSNWAVQLKEPTDLFCVKTKIRTDLVDSE